MRLKINDSEFNVKVADTDAKKSQGLRGVREVPKAHGLLMKWDTPEKVNITMEGVEIPLGLVFINDNKVQDVIEAQPGETNIGIRQSSDMVFETNPAEVVTVGKGDEVELMSSKKDGGTIDYIQTDVPAEGQLHILDDKGIVQGNLNGNERVFSRIHTKQLYGLAIKCKEDKDFAKVGRAIVRMINKQDTQEQEYTDE